MRMACRLDPLTGFQMAGEWLKYQLTAPLDTGPMNCKLPEKHRDMGFIFELKPRINFLACFWLMSLKW